MRPRTPNTWYRKAAVAGSIGVLVVIAAVLFLMLRPGDKHSVEARLLSGSSITAGVSGGLTADAAAGGGLRLCNKTASRVGVAIGYKERQRWTTEGWWNVAAGTCDTLRPGALDSRFYYVYAIDYDEGGVWGGKAAMCTSDKRFTINGIEDCVARGFERRGFFEVDTGEQRSWTVQLTEPGQQGTGG